MKKQHVCNVYLLFKGLHIKLMHNRLCEVIYKLMLLYEHNRTTRMWTL